MDLLISYQFGRFYPMRREARRIIRHLGDHDPRISWTNVDGIAIARTTLDNREVIRRCRDMYRNNEADFEFAVKWLPVDYWCDTDLDAIKQVIDEQAAPRIEPTESWAMVVKKRRWQKYHAVEIIEHIAAGIERKVDLNNPDKIIWVDVVGYRTAVSVLKPEEIFSAILEE